MTGRPWEQRLILESTIRSHENTGSTSSQEGEQGSQLLGFPVGYSPDGFKEVTLRWAPQVTPELYAEGEGIQESLTFVEIFGNSPHERDYGFQENTSVTAKGLPIRSYIPFMGQTMSFEFSST